MVQCVECEDRAAKWSCDNCGDEYCTKCFERCHAKGHKAQHTYRALRFYSMAIRDREEELSAANETAAEARTARAAKEIRDAELSLWAATRLQALWRGRTGRTEGKAHMKHVRKAKREWWAQGKIPVCPNSAARTAQLTGHS